MILRVGASRSRARAAEAAPGLLYFAHVPKTAGTSLRNALVAEFGARRCVALYGAEDPASTPAPTRLFRKALREGVEPEEAARRILVLCEARGVRLLSTHANAAFRSVAAPERTFTILREPVARLVSAWNHRRFRGLPAPGRDFEGFAMSPRMRNVQSRSLAARPLERLALVGLHERFDETVRALNETFGLSLAPRRDNVTAAGGSALRVAELPPALVARIEARHARDVALHRAATAAFEARWGRGRAA